MINKCYSKLGFIDSKCPLCSHTKAKITQVFNSEDAAKHLGISENDANFTVLRTHVTILWDSDICYFVLCLNCSFSYASPNIPGDSKFYNIAYSNEFDYPLWKWDFEISYNTIKDIISRNCVDNIKLLEVGGGNGNFIKKIISNLTSKQNVLVTEFSAYGQFEINKLGIRCLPLNIWDIHSLEFKENFDIVCMFQVLEHMNDFDRLFYHISQLTKKAAHLFISVPNDFHRVFFEKLGFVEDVPPVHIGRWGSKSFDFLGKKYGWIVVSHLIEPNNFFKNVLKYLFFKYKKSNYLQAIYNLKIKNTASRRLLLVIAITPLIIINIKTIITCCNSNLGVSQWIHLKKK